MSDRVPISVQFFPRYLHRAKHMEAVVIEATRRVLWSDATVEIETISAAAYEAATGIEIAAVCDALDRPPRGTT